MIDRIEGSSRPGPAIRLAFEVGDTVTACATLEEAGATVLGPPVATPWGSVNARLSGPAGVQLTLFQPLEPGPEHGPGR